MLGIAHRLAADYTRAELAGGMRKDARQLQKARAAGFEMADLVQREADRERALDALERITPPQREVILLALRDHLDVHGIAARRGSTARAVSVLLREGLTNLGIDMVIPDGSQR